MFERIAVALDGSECSMQAFDLALQLAGSVGAEIGVCSVVDPVVVAGSAPPSPAMELVVRDMETSARRLVTEAVERARQAGLVASGQTRSGVPAYEVIKYAEHFHADLIVMGTHGRKGVKHLLMGSVAEMILRESAIPVLVIRGAKTADRAGAVSEKPEKQAAPR